MKVSMEIGPDKLGDSQDVKLRALLDAARVAYHEWHGSHVWIDHPCTCKGTSDFHDLEDASTKLADAMTAVGAHLLERLGLASDLIQDGIDYTLGKAFFDNNYADLIGRLRNTRDWFREGKWDKLYEEGSLDNEEYQELIAVPLS